MPGSDAGAPASADEVAEATVGALAGVPFTTAGVAFLSGGQRPERATENLAAMQRLPHIWPLTFSFGRALVDPALAAWRGEPARWAAGQRALARRVSMNVAALDGRYTPELELDPACERRFTPVALTGVARSLVAIPGATGIARSRRFPWGRRGRPG